MKKIIALALSVLMILTCLVGCGDDAASGNLDSAIAFLDNMYQTGKKDEPMLLGVDKNVLTVVTVDGVSYDVEWSIEVTEGDKDAVKISESETENCVKIDVPDLTETDILFTAKATVKDADDNEATAEYKFKVKGIEIADDVDVESILNDAYALEEGKKMEAEVTLTGVITSVDTPYSDQYKNVTVTIAIQDFEDKPIKCYRLAGDGADTLAVGDTITVTGTLTNYQGTIEFGQGCTVKAIVKADGTTTTPDDTTSTPTTSTPTTSTPTTSTPTTSTPTTSTPSTELKLVTDQAKILKDAFALGANETTPYIAQLTGKVTSAQAYSEQYGSMTVIISVGGKSIKCFNMKGDGVKNVKAGDTITVVGVIKNYQYSSGTTEVEFTWDEASQTEVKMTKRVAGQTEKPLSVVTNPVAGTAYKFGMIQGNVSTSKVYYLAGGMSGYYMATGEVASAAIDVYLEENTAGGFYLYTMLDGAKTYINMVTSGTHVNGAYESTAKTVYTYDATSQTIIATVDGAPYWFGTRNDKTYTTVGPCKTEYQGFYCKFYQ